MLPQNIKRGQKVSNRLTVTKVAKNTFVVCSETDFSKHYTVNIYYFGGDTIGAACDCEFGNHGGVGCKHVMAALSELSKGKGRILSFWKTEEEALQQKRRVLRLTGKSGMGDTIYITSRPMNK
jgi:uncharacterized Zn finger protein